MIPANLSPLANHLWQSTLFAATVWLLTLALSKNRARVRYRLWLAASVKFLVPFSLLVSAGAQFGWRTAPAIAQPQFSFVVEEIAQPFAAAAPPAPAAANPVPVILFCLWFCGFAASVIFWFRGWHQMRAARHSATPFGGTGGSPSGSPVRPDVPVLSTPTHLEPGVFGIYNPVLLLPAGIADRLTPAQLEAVIAHELCHVRRRDNLTAAIHLTVEAVFWFHPLVWFIRQQLVEERERACDEEVLCTAANADDYAEGILNVCKFYLESPPLCVSGVTGANLKKRIEEILANRVASSLNLGRMMLLLAAGSLALAVPIATGLLHPSPGRAQSQPGSTRTFDVASIKISQEPEGSSTWNSSPAGTLRMRNQTLRACIQIAYGVKDSQISAGPKWIDSERFHIDAKAPGPAKDPELLLMLQTLLQERFQLKFHRETRPFPGYALVAAKSGLKIHAVEPTRINRLNSRGGHMTAEGVSLEKFAQVLSSMVGSLVVDDTRVAGVFNFKLDWTPEDRHTGAPPEGDGGPMAISAVRDPAGGITLFSALQDQLGLKLEPRKLPLEVLVIDRAERPSEN